MSDYNTTKLATIGQFRFWCQKVLPAVYDDSLSYYELLCKVIHKLNEIIELDNEQSESIKIIVEELQNLANDFEKFKESGFEDYYKAQVEKWISNNLEYIYRYTIKQIYFGLTSDGYWCAWIPDSWDDITFDTIMNYSNPNYGSIVLRY